MSEKANMVMAHQIRAARAMVGLGQKDLAEKAEVAVATLRRMESDDIGPSRSSFAAVEAVCRILEAAGVEFIDAGDTSPAGGPGVRLRKDRPE